MLPIDQAALIQPSHLDKSAAPSFTSLRAENCLSDHSNGMGFINCHNQVGLRFLNNQKRSDFNQQREGHAASKSPPPDCSPSRARFSLQRNSPNAGFMLNSLKKPSMAISDLNTGCDVDAVRLRLTTATMKTNTAFPVDDASEIGHEADIHS